MKFHHLSPEEGLEFILPSSENKTSTSITPRIPEKSSYEHDMLRVCVAPTVWQCLLSIPRCGILYIYRVETENITKPLGKVGDIDHTHEKWVTDKGIIRSNGRIELINIGFIDKTIFLYGGLLNCKDQNKLPLPPKDESCIWDVSDDGVWTTNLFS